ncbi:MAG: fibronectin type III domain-containing protein [Lachnospiraceae bacterium]|nr:fibronectin type III domain-containing protein [Lachnospiraceae bacterium]
MTGATSYKIYRKVGTSGSYVLCKKVKSTKTSYTDTSLEPGTRYAYKVVAVTGSYKSASSAKACKTLTATTSANVDALYAIEADVKLTGSGTGYHAKLVAATAQAAVSFGIQFDNYASSPWTGKAAFLIENVVNTGSGGQYYSRTGLSAENTTNHLMLTVLENGVCELYVNYQKVGSVTNSSFATLIKNGQTIYLRVEGSARKNGDSVTATFSNISLKENGSAVDTPVVSIVYLTGEGITCTTKANTTPDKIVISGTLSGLTSAQDWDSAADIVSGIVQYY